MLIQLLTCKHRQGCNFFDCILQKKRLFTLEEITSVAHKPLYCARRGSTVVLTTYTSLEVDGNVLGSNGDYIKGARVKLLPGHYFSSQNNPGIGSEWECFGTLTHCEAGLYIYEVSWDNHAKNSYKLWDLILINNNCRSIWNNQ